MAVDPRRLALAYGRFGLGARPGDLARGEAAEDTLRREVLSGTVPMPSGPDLAATRVLDLYEARDPALAAALARGLDVDALAQGGPRGG
ncbi:hypothetical protein [Methylobacterium variabile]|jgi:uncharacterized protein (DUF1800 family)|uniref:hypothetical protein n=1 Tax=Methylobacterium variabile TaxID=298794 RepID=UPI00069F45CE